MAGWKTHAAAGALTGGLGLVVAHQFGKAPSDPLHLLGLGATAVLFALFPDVDTDSIGRRVFYSLAAFADVVLIVNKQIQLAAIFGLLAMLPAVSAHRGWTHTWWAGLVAPLPVLALPMLFFKLSQAQVLPFYIAATVGYFSHLALDRQA